MNKDKKPLSETHPELAKEANGWDPSTVISGSRKKLEWKCAESHIWSSRLSHRANGVGCPYCSNKKVLAGFNDLATTHPELADEAFGWDPSTVIAGSDSMKDWKCRNNHLYKSRLGHRTKRNHGCPFCSGRIAIKGFNDLATINPDLAKEAFGWDPTLESPQSNKSKTWKCKLGHIWKAPSYNRMKDHGCPYCSNQKVLAGFNDLATTHPELADEAFGWDPSTVIAGTFKKIKWKCKEGHVWSAPGYTRIKNIGCPSCASSGFDPNKNGFLYFMLQPNWEIYQIGITNVPDIRLKSHNRNGFELLELRGPMDGHTAQELETAVLRYLKSQKADLSPEHVAGKFDGYSESWTIDSFQVNNLKELLDKTREAGY